MLHNYAQVLTQDVYVALASRNCSILRPMASFHPSLCHQCARLWSRFAPFFVLFLFFVFSHGHTHRTKAHAAQFYLTYIACDLTPRNQHSASTGEFSSHTLPLICTFVEPFFCTLPHAQNYGTCATILSSL